MYMYVLAAEEAADNLGGGPAQLTAWAQAQRLMRLPCLRWPTDHVLDWSVPGLLETLDTLERAGGGRWQAGGRTRQRAVCGRWR